VRRTHAFVVDVSNADADEKTEGQLEVGPRYVEGAAGGAILIGTAPRTRGFMEHFGWADSVLAVEPSAEAIRSTLEVLEANPGRVARIRLANVRNVLLRHDVAYRWELILETFGLAALPPLEGRKRLLAQAAESVADRDPAVPRRAS
jgi:hypothetical protein